MPTRTAKRGRARLYFSERALPLVYVGEPPAERGILTVENYLKWYCPYVILPGPKVVKLDDLPEADRVWDRLERASLHPAFCDHTWHPGFIRAVCDDLGLDVDEQALEMIAGRWCIETLNLPSLDYQTAPSAENHD